MRSKNYQDELLKSLREPEEASAYLNAAIEEKDAKVFQTAIRNVIEAHGGKVRLNVAVDFEKKSTYS